MTRSLRRRIKRQLRKDFLIKKHLKQLTSNEEAEELFELLCDDQSDLNTNFNEALKDNNFTLAALTLYCDK